MANQYKKTRSSGCGCGGCAASFAVLFGLIAIIGSNTESQHRRTSSHTVSEGPISYDLHDTKRESAHHTDPPMDAFNQLAESIFNRNDAERLIASVVELFPTKTVACQLVNNYKLQTEEDRETGNRLLVLKVRMSIDLSWWFKEAVPALEKALSVLRLQSEPCQTFQLSIRSGSSPSGRGLENYKEDTSSPSGRGLENYPEDTFVDHEFANFETYRLNVGRHIFGKFDGMIFQDSLKELGVSYNSVFLLTTIFRHVDGRLSGGELKVYEIPNEWAYRLREILRLAQLKAEAGNSTDRSPVSFDFFGIPYILSSFNKNPRYKYPTFTVEGTDQAGKVVISLPIGFHAEIFKQFCYAGPGDWSKFFTFIPLFTNTSGQPWDAGRDLVLKIKLEHTALEKIKAVRLRSGYFRAVTN